MTTSRPEIADRIDIEEEKVRELAENIREQGLLQSPLVRKVGNEYEIIAGDRRILAVKKLGWSEIECVVCQMTDAQAAEARASENLAREDLTVIEEARVYERLLKTYGYTIKQIAEKMGKSAGVVKRRLDLLKMPQCLQDAIIRCGRGPLADLRPGRIRLLPVFCVRPWSYGADCETVGQ